MRVIARGRKGESVTSTMCLQLRMTSFLRCSFFKWAEFDDDGEPPWAKTPSSKASQAARGLRSDKADRGADREQLST